MPGTKILAPETVCTAAMHRYAGKGPEDKFPAITPVDALSGFQQNVRQSIDCKMAPYSITVFQFDGKE